MEGKLLVAHIDTDTLSFGGKRKSLEAVNLIKEDRCEKMKGKIMQMTVNIKRYIKEGERISSPTVSLEGLFCTIIMYENEWRDMDTFEVQGAYLHA